MPIGKSTGRRKFSQAQIDLLIANGRKALKVPPEDRTPEQRFDIEEMKVLGEPAESEIKRARKRFDAKSKKRGAKILVD